MAAAFAASAFLELPRWQPSRRKEIAHGHGSAKQAGYGDDATGGSRQSRSSVGRNRSEPERGTSQRALYGALCAGEPSQRSDHVVPSTRRHLSGGRLRSLIGQFLSEKNPQSDGVSSQAERAEPPASDRSRDLGREPPDRDADDESQEDAIVLADIGTTLSETRGPEFGGKTFDPEKELFRQRRRMADFAMWLLAGTIGACFIIVGSGLREWEEIDRLVTVVLPVVAATSASAVAFFLGSGRDGH